MFIQYNSSSSILYYKTVYGYSKKLQYTVCTVYGIATVTPYTFQRIYLYIL
jgi:hypothetical protein